MKNKSKNKIDGSKNYIKWTVYFMYFYFGIRLILIPITFAAGGLEILGVGNLVLNLAIGVLGLVSAYKLSQHKRWALITLVAIFVVSIASLLYIAQIIGIQKIPLVQIAALLMLIGAFRHIKK